MPELHAALHTALHTESRAQVRAQSRAGFLVHFLDRSCRLTRTLRCLGAVLLLALGPVLAPAWAADPPTENDGARVLQTFETPAPSTQADAAERTRRWVMFALGAPLLVLLLTTAGLGIAMGIYGKPVYLAHMICAGLTVTLAITHAIVGLVWFRPF